MASKAAHKRLTKEYKALQAAPPPYIEAHPNERNILEWHYVVTGPPDTDYEGGQYHGTLMFPSEYPFKPPAIRMITPSGRLEENKRLCLSYSDFHPREWNPAWQVSTILTGLLSFMTSEESTQGSIQTSPATRKRLAAASRRWNALQNPRFKDQFPELVKEYLSNPAKYDTPRSNSQSPASAPAAPKRPQSNSTVPDTNVGVRAIDPALRQDRVPKKAAPLISRNTLLLAIAAFVILWTYF